MKPLNKLLQSGVASISKSLNKSLPSLGLLGAAVVVIGVITIGTSYRNVSNLNSGTLSDARLSGNIAKLNSPDATFKGHVSAAGFAGNLVGNVTGDLLGNAATATAFATQPTGCDTGSFANSIDTRGNLGCSNDGSGLVNIKASSLTGTVSDTHLSSNVAKLDALSQVFSGTITAASFNGNFTGNISGNAAGFTGSLSGDVTGTQGATVVSHVNAGNIDSGTLSDSRLSAHVAKYNDASPTFANLLTAAGFAGDLTGNVTGNADTATALAANPVDCAAGAFATSIAANGDLSCSTDGSNLTAVDADSLQGNSGSYYLDASNINSGTLNSSFLPAVATLQGNTFNGASQLVKLDSSSKLPSVDGSNLTNLTGANVVGDISGNAATATALQTPVNINGVSFDGTSDITVAVDAGALTGTTLASNVVSSSLTSVGTLTDLTVTNPISGSVTGSSGSTTGNAATATKLQTARTINGTSFNGTANITVTAAAGTLTGTTLKSTVVSSSLTSVGTLTGLTVSSTINGSISGNAATASALQNPVNINGVSFDGTSDITIAVDAADLTGDTLASNVLNSSLTSVGTLTDLTVTNTITGSISGNAGTATDLATNPVDCGPGDFATAIDVAGNLSCSNDGSSLISVDAASLQGNSPSYYLDASNISAGTLSNSRLTSQVTLQGNTFNGASQLVKLDASSLLPAVDGSALTNLTGTNVVGDISGNAGTSTALQNARNIGGVSFNGTADITVASATGGFTVSGGNLDIGTNSLLLTGSIASSGSRVTKGWFSDLDVTNTITGSISGNAATATKLQTARSINGVSFDGSADITVTADASTLTGTTLNSTVVNSSLTSVGTLSGLTATGTVDFSGGSAFIPPVVNTALTTCAPSQEGYIVYDQTGHKFYGCDGTNWDPLN